MWADVTASARAALATVDRRLVAWAVAWSAASLVAFGVLTAIIPSPFLVRLIEPEPFALVVWIVSAPLMGLVAATYTSPARVSTSAPVPLTAPATRRDGSTIGTLAGLGTFLAIGCPICNKVALVLLGTSGALSVWAPLQPVVGVVSLVLLVVTVAWRFQLRARGGACPA